MRFYNAKKNNIPTLYRADRKVINEPKERQTKYMRLSSYVHLNQKTASKSIPMYKTASHSTPGLRKMVIPNKSNGTCGGCGR